MPVETPTATSSAWRFANLLSCPDSVEHVMPGRLVRMAATICPLLDEVQSSPPSLPVMQEPLELSGPSSATPEATVNETPSTVPLSEPVPELPFEELLHAAMPAAVRARSEEER